MPGSNYPPGTSAGDPRAPWNEPHNHEHEFRPLDDSPIIEDGAAIFHEECNYAEGRYGDGWQCEETRTYRFEYSTLESPDGKEYDVKPIEEWEENIDLVKQQVIHIEERHCYVGPGDEETDFDVDPDPECGVVTIEYEGWTLRYEP